MPAPDVTQLLLDLSGGDRRAVDQLLPVVYDELRRLAHERLRYERESHTLATTDLVHEAYVRLADGARVEWQGRAHFFAVASGVMRRLLVDWARARRAEKRGGGLPALSLDAFATDIVPAEVRADELLALDEALERLATLSERQARVVECRYFAGLSVDETAEALGLSQTTVKLDWRLARAWLYRDLHDGHPA